MEIKNPKSKIGIKEQLSVSNGNIPISLLCFQLKRDIDRVLNQWMTESSNNMYKKEEPSLKKTQVRSMSEFLEKISREDEANSEASGEAKRSGIRRYELVDWRQHIKPVKREETRYFRGTLLPSRLCSMLEEDIDEPLNLDKIIIKNSIHTSF